MYCLLFAGRLDRESSTSSSMRSPRCRYLTQTEENKMPSIGNTKRLKVLQTKCIDIIKLMLRWHLCFLQQRHCPTILNLTQSKQSKSPFKYFHHIESKTFPMPFPSTRHTNICFHNVGLHSCQLLFQPDADLQKSGCEMHTERPSWQGRAHSLWRGKGLRGRGSPAEHRQFPSVFRPSVAPSRHRPHLQLESQTQLMSVCTLNYLHIKLYTLGIMRYESALRWDVAIRCKRVPPRNWIRKMTIIMI